MNGRASAIVFLLTIGVAAACGSKQQAVAPKRPMGGVVRSNVARDDYAGSAACAPCHAEIHERFVRSPMHNMTRKIESAKVQAPFDGTVFHFKDDFATLETHAGKKFVRLETREKGASLYRVTKVIGGRHREDFAGVLVSGTDDDEGGAAAEKILPVSFMLSDKTLRYKGYSVMDQERPGLRASGEWRRRCIFCHNTEPYLDVLLSGLDPDAKPYQGVVVDALLPEARRMKLRVTDEGAFRDALHAEIQRLEAADAVQVARATSVKEAVGRAINAIRARFDERNLLEVGIGCESCHGGSREHVDDPSVKPSFLPRAPWLGATLPKGADAAAQAETRACARCHQVLFSAYPFTWEGALRAKEPGGSNINSGEARDFLLGGCASKLACSRCHDPHAADRRQESEALEGAKGNAICTSCHATYATKEAHRAHAHHDPDGAGGACVACHMPRKNVGLAGKLVRYHRIASPTDRAKVELDRPLECALCHPTKSVRELVTTMQTWWNKSYDAAAIEKLYGGLDASPVLATLGLGRPHEQAVAIAISGESKLRPSVPFLVPHATHSVPLLRYWVVDALESILGGPSPVDLHRSNADIAKAVRAWVTKKGYVLPSP